ncbi:MAG TPA: helix-turn-helix domain-containing protein [Puia sp.]
MDASVETDIVVMLRHLVMSLKVFAKTHEVNLLFQSKRGKIVLSYDPEEIVHVIVTLICRAVIYTPPNQTISLACSLTEEAERKILKINISITGINLFWISQVTQDIKQSITVQSTPDGGTRYSLEWPFMKTMSSAMETNRNPGNYHQNLPSFYSEIRKQLQSHFTKSDKLLAALVSRHPKDAVFLQKVNFLILTNIDKDGFNANHLSTALGMSRTQLYRTLHPIIRQAPGIYIRTMRIQKAKELMETTDMRIGEVAFNTGFQTPSHFTRVFIKHYGVRPSVFRRNTKM